MDARQRLNQLRRLKTRRLNQNRKQLTDLRQLIDRNDNKSVKNKNKRKPVKTRIGFQTKNNNQRQRRQTAVDRKNNRKDSRKPTINKMVLLDERQRLPTVVVDLSQIEDIPTVPSVPSVSHFSSQSMYSSGSQPKPTATTNESKKSVLVSNLNETITDTDIEELFGEMGPIVKSSKINSTVALIVYNNQMDARKACHTYHNRLLDGLPMQCNILSLSSDEYTIDSPPKRQTQPPKPTALLASQLRQINAIYRKPSRGQTSAKKRLNNRSNARFV